MSSQLTYQSPIRIFETLGLDPENVDVNALRMDRKRLLLEVQISPTQTTEFNGKEVGKNDVIELFDRIEGVTNLAFHRIIFDHPDLLNLLETQKLSELNHYVRVISFTNKEEESAFRAFVSPYLAEAYSKASASVLRNGNYLSLLQTSAYFRLLSQSDVYIAFRNIENYCKILQKNLNNHTWNNDTFNAKEYEFIYYQPFYDLINKLSVYFNNLPNIVAEAIINFSVDNQHKIGRGRYLVTVSDQARRLHCSAELKSILINNRDAFWSSREESLAFDPNKVWRIIVFSILIIITGFRILDKCEVFEDSRTSEQATLEKLIMDFDENKVITKQTKPRRDESFLLDLHETTLSRVINRQFNESRVFVDQAPKLIPTFERFDSTITHSPVQTVMLQNNTNSEILMILMDDDRFISQFIGKFETIELSFSTNASVFFYSGDKWRNEFAIGYDLVALNGEFMYMNGSFKHVSQKNIEFLSRFYSLRDEPTTQLFIEDEDGQYELYQNGASVNYSY